MTITSTEITGWIGAYLWPFFRIGAMVAAAPLFGTRFVPVRIRVVFAIVLTILVVPLVAPVPTVDALSAEGLLISMQQVLIGLVTGFTLQLVFGAFVLGGQILAMAMGLGFASMNDPASGVVVPTLGQFYTVMVTLVFLAINGHLVLVSVIVDSFSTMPIAALGMTADTVWRLVAWAGQMFAGAVIISLPAVTAMLVVNIGFGVMTRAAPQLNIFAVGFAVIMTLGFVVMLVALPGVAREFSTLADAAFSMMRYNLAGVP